MIASDAMRAAAARLEAVLSDGRLAPGAAKAGARLLRRLSMPVRVVLLGPPGSGKTTLLNAIAGEVIVPAGLDLPTVEVAWAAAPRLVVTAGDGTVTDRPAGDLRALAGSDAALVRIERPLGALGRLTLTEVVAGGDPDELAAAARWAARRADLVIWCSQGFAPAERAAWSVVPETVKDNALLAIAKADALAAERKLAPRLGALSSVAAEEFDGLYPVAARQALDAFGAEGARDQALWRKSGAAALVDELMRREERGRGADLDAALLFLARYAPDDAGAVPAGPQAEPAAGADASAPGPVDDTDETARASARKAGDYLRRRAAELSATLARDGEETLLDQCLSTAESLADLVSLEADGDPRLLRLADDIAQAAELMLLMQIEAGRDPAADAVTLLLQLRRDLDARAAA